MKLLAKNLFLACLLMVAGFGTATAQNNPDSLQNGFQNPPESARPRVWWHWMNGNITKEGITADLQWMHRAGLGGYQNFDAAL
ncbi:MAG TPA: glycosyl hydrolase, partial [Terracidiphilus sp.]|nr:glycosyl hydrolase [Terracidiphilus sp.]